VKSGIYIHIPFCTYKCPYCDFYSLTETAVSKKEYTELITKEAELRNGQIPPPETLYFGGGTPSLLEPQDIERIMESLDRNLDLSSVKEVTLEANPESLSSKKLRGFREAGVNRLSIGVQSFSLKGLKTLGRKHSPDDSIRAFLMAREEGFENINIDLIWGWEEQRKEDLLHDLERTLELRPEHVSLYLLTYHPGTPMGELYKKGKVREADEERISDFYRTMGELLRNSGYKHYEVSNWSLEGRECRHNILYWERKPFLGLGAGAWGFVNGFRYANVMNLEKYGEMVKKGLLPEARRLHLSPEESFEERVMLGLRLSKGLPEVIVRIPPHLEEFFERKEGRVAIREEFLILSNELITEVLVYNSPLNNLTEV